MLRSNCFHIDHPLQTSPIFTRQNFLRNNETDDGRRCSSRNCHSEKMSKDWLFQNSSTSTTVEKFYPGGYLKCSNSLFGNQTELNANDGRIYPYVPDEMKHLDLNFDNIIENRPLLKEYYSEFASERAELSIDSLMHVTDRSSVRGILRDRVIKAFPKQFHFSLSIGQEMDIPLVWFMADMTDQASKSYVQRSITERQSMIAAHFYYKSTGNIKRRYWQFNPDHFTTSVPFGNTPYNQPHKNQALCIDFNSLIDAYCGEIDAEKPIFRRLGTFTYKTEVMYSVLIHPPEEELTHEAATFLQQFPLIKKIKTEDVVVPLFKRGSDFIWKPVSTSTDFGRYQNGSRKFCRWDHPAFAFYFSDGAQGFDMSDLEYGQKLLN